MTVIQLGDAAGAGRNSRLRVLVVGSGGREHALCWKLSQSPLMDELFCAPGNPGISEVADCVAIPADEIGKLAEFARDLKIDLTIVGPELPLTLGIVDEFRGRDLNIFGPNRVAAELEGSKVFAKELMHRCGVPTAKFKVAHSADEARKAAKPFGFPVVLKADGLAGGKGVFIVDNKVELTELLEVFFEERRFGVSGDRLVVEERLVGEEVSLIALCDGQRLIPMAACKDYKRIGDGDTGPNTGGMGAHSPSGVLKPQDVSEIIEIVFRPIVDGMAEENRPFQGFLYAGVMLTEDGPQVLEFNVRLGDPEAQALLLRVENDLLPVLAEGARGQFETAGLEFRREAAACIVLAAAGYPGVPRAGDPIQGLEAGATNADAIVFHAGTKIEDGRWSTNGGRVVNVCATGATLRDALRTAYQAAAEIRWRNQVFRRDIGRRVVEAGEQGSSPTSPS